MQKQRNKKKVVVIGGGTGTHTVLLGLKRYRKLVNIAAIITMADSGGSTGRLRDEFGCLPVGDARMALAAMASDIDDHAELLRQLFLYRFAPQGTLSGSAIHLAKGEGLSGHSFGNLFLVALTDILGSEEAAIQTAARVLRVRGAVVPVTSEQVDLVATYDDGVQVVGEHEIDEPAQDRWSHKITNLAVTPVATISQSAANTIATADLIVLGPGDLYTSVLANCVVGGVAEALVDTTAKIVYVSNLMTKLGQTSGMGVTEHVREIAGYIGRTPDYVITNTATFPKELLQKYASQKEYPVALDFVSDKHTRNIAGDLLATESVKTVSGDTLKRSLIRHDSLELAKKLMSILEE